MAVGNWIKSGDDMKDFRQLKVWENAHEMALILYKLTAGFPKHALFGLTSQI